MERASYAPFRGVVTDIRTAGPRGSEGCQLIYRLENEEGSLAEFLITPDTYFLHQQMVGVGTPVIGFYDVNEPMVLSYPPRYRPAVVAVDNQPYNMKLDYFDRNLLSSDGELQLQLSAETFVTMTNGQYFYGEVGGRVLLVLYGVTTRSIPARTTPWEIIVFCGR